MIRSVRRKYSIQLTWVGAICALGALGVGCSTSKPISDDAVASSTEARASRSPASTATVLRKLMVDAGEEGSAWLAKLLGGAEGEALAGRVRNGLSTLKPSEIREDQRLVSILSKDALDVTEADARYLLDIASNRAVNLANCPECLLRRNQFLGNRKVIRDRLKKVAEGDPQVRRHMAGFLKRVETLMDKGVTDPKVVSDLMTAINAERFKGKEVIALMDTIQAMLLSVGKDLDPKAAADIVNNWPDSSLKGLRKFYSEVVLVQASDGVELEAAADVVLRRLNVSDGEEMKVLKVCSMIRR